MLSPESTYSRNETVETSQNGTNPTSLGTTSAPSTSRRNSHVPESEENIQDHSAGETIQHLTIPLIDPTQSESNQIDDPDDSAFPLGLCREIQAVALDNRSTTITLSSQPKPTPNTLHPKSDPHICFPYQVVSADFFTSSCMDTLEIIGTAGHKITHMGTDLYQYLPHYAQMTHFILRSHLIRKMEGLRFFTNLRLLELYDNQIEALEDLEPLTVLDPSFSDGVEELTTRNQEEEEETEELQTDSRKENLHSIFTWPGKTLQILDMSYNVIRDMEPVQFCPNLKELYLANNKIKEMKGLQHLIHLQKLDLGANRIRIMDSAQLSGLIHLEELWLGKNKIEQIDGIQQLQKLRRLDVQSNRLTFVHNLHSQQDTLEELYLADNGIDDEGLSLPSSHTTKGSIPSVTFSQLTTLDLSRNRIRSCQHFAHLHTLTDLWLSGNLIDSFDQVEPIRCLGSRDRACLESIYLEYNPIYKDFEYRKRIKDILPSLEQIDAERVDGGLCWKMMDTSNLTNRSTVSTKDSAADISLPLGSSMRTPSILVNESTEERLKRMQDIAIRKATKKTEENNQN